MKSFSQGDLQDMDFEAYLASSDDEGEDVLGLASDEDEGSHSEDEEEKIAKYKVGNVYETETTAWKDWGMKG